MTPLISIVIPVYNAAAEIGLCLESILSSHWPHFEVIIVDDGSTDNSLEIVNGYGCRAYRSVSNLGPAHARNFGVGMTSADIVLFLDADTYVPADAIRLFYEAFVSHPDILAVIALPAIRSLRRGRAPDYNALRNHFSLLSAEPVTDYFTTQMGAIRKQAFVDVGGFSEKYRHADIEDFELGLRLHQDTVLIHKKIVIGHHFPPLGSILRKYFHRASLLARLTLERRRLSKAHSTVERVVSVCMASLAILCLPLGAISGVFLVFSGLASMVMVALNFSLFRFAVRQRGISYLFEAVFFEYIFSLAICSGGLFGKECRR